MFREAAQWLEEHDLCQTGDYMVDAEGNSVSWLDEPVKACIVGSCLIVNKGFPDDVRLHEVLGDKIREMFPEAYLQVATWWNDHLATKQQVVQVLNTLADERE